MAKVSTSRSHSDDDTADVAAIRAAQAAVVDEFSFFDTWEDKYRHLIDLGRGLPPFPETEKTEENRLKGCQSQVWFVARRDSDGRIHVQAMSDAAIVSGLVALLLRVYSGRLPQAILDTPPAFIEEIGLVQHLSATRANGLGAMMGAIRALAAGRTAG